MGRAVSGVRRVGEVMKDEPAFPDKEMWASIDGWKPYYEVSNHGRVRSFIRSGHILAKPNLKKLQLNKNGYYYVQLEVRKKVKRYSVHKLVLSTFSPHIDMWELDCAHKDGNKTNNHLSNLKWSTRKENEQDKKRHGTYDLSRQRKLCKYAEVAIGKLHNQYGFSQNELGRIFGVSQQTVCNTIKRQISEG